MAKKYEDCNPEEKTGWEVGQDEFINGTLPGNNMREFLAHLRAKLASKGHSKDFINGAEWGARGET